MYLYFDKNGALKTMIPHGEVPRQGNPLNLYLCFDEDRFFEEDRNKFLIKILFTFPDGTLSNTYRLDPEKDDEYLGLVPFEKLSDSEITYDLVDGVSYHTFRKSFPIVKKITALYGKLTVHVQFCEDEHTFLFEENGNFYVERTIGNNLKKTTITPDEYEELQILVNEYILKFNDITFITDAESLESIERPDPRHLYRIRNSKGVLEYYNYKNGEWYRFVTGGEFAVLSATVEEQGNAIVDLQTLSRENQQKIGELTTQDILIRDEIKLEETRRIQEDGKLRTSLETEIDERKSNDNYLQGQIDEETEKNDNRHENLQGQISTNKTDITKKISIDFSNILQASAIHKDDSIIIRCNDTTYTITVDYLAKLINTEVDYFKGYYTSLEGLIAKFPVGEPGDYAFVGADNDEQYHMYVWDNTPGKKRWEETISGQYVGTSTFDTFQRRLQEGSVHVGAVKANVENSEETDPLLINIEINGETFALPSMALEFLGEAIEGAYKLGAIKINGDVWNINNDVVGFEFSDENVEGAYELGSIKIGTNVWNVAKLSDVLNKLVEFNNNANAYTDTKATETLNSAKTYADTKGTETLNAAKAYADAIKRAILGEDISETYDTLKEIQNWIEGDGVNATELSQAVAGKQDKLTPGNGISISDEGVISINYPDGDEEVY